MEENGKLNAKRLAQQLRRASQTEDQREEQRRRNTERRRELRLAQSQERRRLTLEQDSIRHRNSREQLSQTERQIIQQRNAEEHRNARIRLSQEDRQRIQQQDAAQHRNTRIQLSQDERVRIQQENAEQHRIAREQLPQGDRQRIQQQDAEQHRIAREQLPQDERQRIRQENAEQHRIAREQLPEDERLRIQQENAEQHRIAREQLPQGEQQRIQEQDAAQHRRVRQQNRQRNFNAAKRCDIDGFLQISVNVARHSCGLMEVRCRHCNSLMFMGEKTGGTINNPNFGICCKSGLIKITNMPELPDDLSNLYTANTSEAKYFRSNIRRFNSAMAMCSMKVDDATILRGISNYRIHGMVYRLFGAPRNQHGTSPSCLQTYFYDPEEQIRQRIHRMPLNNANPIFDENIFRIIHSSMISAGNTYLESFLSVQEQIDAGTIPSNVSIALHADKKPDAEHSRRYNLPTANEVAILLPDGVDNDTNYSERSVLTKFREADSERRLQTLSDCHRSYDPMMYPCFFPSGTDGWHLGIMNTTGTRQITLVQYYSHCIMKRAQSVNVLHFGNRLFQQYCVDQFAKVQSCRLRYIRNNQATLRSDLYNGLEDAIHAGDADRTGRRFILPPSFTGSPRYMAKHYQDAMAICEGNAPVFLSYTFVHR